MMYSWVITPCELAEAMQAAEKVLFTSMLQQIFYTVFKAVGTPFETNSTNYRERWH